MKAIQKRFHLIELMIVIAIIGIWQLSLCLLTKTTPVALKFLKRLP